jgi:hypothetical protein
VPERAKVHKVLGSDFDKVGIDGVVGLAAVGRDTSCGLLVTLFLDENDDQLTGTLVGPAADVHGRRSRETNDRVLSAECTSSVVKVIGVANQGDIRSPQVGLSSIVHICAIGKHLTLVDPRTLGTGSSVDGNTTSSRETEVSAIGCTANKGWVVSIGTCTTARKRVGVGQDCGGQRHNARKDGKKLHIEEQEQNK